jgi:opacity protein-like surface antigen
MIRKLSVLTSVLIILGASISNAQTLSVAKQGDKAVLFNFVGLSAIDLGAYQGGIGGKYFFSDGLAARAMLLFGVDNKTTSGIPQGTDNSLSFGIGGGIEYHLPLAYHVSPYLGGILSFRTSAETVNPGANKTSSTSFGLGAIGGIEYFFNENLSLAAEYQFGFTSTSYTGLPDQNELKFGFQTAGLTLAAYF